MAMLLVALLALFVAALGALGVVSPAGLVAAVARVQTPAGLYAIAALRIVFGVAMTLAAPESKLPAALFYFGIFTLIAGILTPFFGLERFRAILDWWSQRPEPLLRAWAAVALAFGLTILWAVV